MKFLRASIAVLCLTSTAFAEDAAPTQKTTFYVSGIECGSCVYAVYQSVSETKGVSAVAVVQRIDNYANVTFDPRAITEHQIAQAVRDSYALHGMPYLATLKLHLPDYASNSAKVEAVFARWKDLVKLECADATKGDLEIHFLPLKEDEKKKGPQGWSLAQLTAALQNPAPEGLGLKFTVEKEDSDQ
ncbi:MAG: heavy-metal-associated domain-containing protein [Verrucomicrobiaceae bacterium]|nr:heavy-metal-associated domain-containing protein [Verrucomicrobiaceae bacterium]